MLERRGWIDADGAIRGQLLLLWITETFLRGRVRDPSSDATLPMAAESETELDDRLRAVLQ